MIWLRPECYSYEDVHALYYGCRATLRYHAIIVSRSQHQPVISHTPECCFQSSVRLPVDSPCSVSGAVSSTAFQVRAFDNSLSMQHALRRDARCISRGSPAILACIRVLVNLSETDQSKIRSPSTSLQLACCHRPLRADYNGASSEGIVTTPTQHSRVSEELRDPVQFFLDVPQITAFNNFTSIAYVRTLSSSYAGCQAAGMLGLETKFC